MGRSLWLDEAWVANSIQAHSLAGMFYPSDWLQTTPPVVLLLARFSLAIFGISNAALRVAPLIMALLAVAATLLLASRTLWRHYALLAWMLLILSPTEITLAREVKQYSSEFFASTAILLACTFYIQRSTRKRFWLLLAIAAVCLSMSYGCALLMPGVASLFFIVPVTPNSTPRRNASLSSSVAHAATFSAIVGSVALCIYRVFAVPNSSPALHDLFFSGPGLSWTLEYYRFIGEMPLGHFFNRQSVRLFCVFALLFCGFILSWIRLRHGNRNWFATMFVCLLPCLIIVIADHLSLYPFSQRTSLFALPGLVLAIVSSLQLLSVYLMTMGRPWIRPVLDLAILLAIVLTLNASRSQNARNIAPTEDADGAIAYLKTHVQPHDLVWVHASLREQFQLYLRMHGWDDAPVRFGNTAWPCCARGIPDIESTSSEALVRNDFGNAVQQASGRVWIAYTTRSGHWSRFPDEPGIMRRILAEHGCTETAPQPPAFNNLALLSFECRPQSASALPQPDTKSPALAKR